jgi:hypothetical protein
MIPLACLIIQFLPSVNILGIWIDVNQLMEFSATGRDVQTRPRILFAIPFTLPFIVPFVGDYNSSRQTPFVGGGT